MDELIKLSCPFCGGKLEIPINSNKVTCSYCGQDSAITGSKGLINNQSACPVCGDKDQVQKVSGIILTDSPIAQHLRPPDKPAVLSFEEFSRRVPAIPPPIKDFKKSSTTVVLIFAIITGLSFLYVVLGTLIQWNDYSARTMGFQMLAVVSPIFAVFAFISGKNIKNNRAFKEKEKSFQESLRMYQEQCAQREETLRTEYESYARNSVGNWQKAMSRWELLYYCKRDNILFIPGASRHVPVKEFMAYLYSEEL